MVDSVLQDAAEFLADTRFVDIPPDVVALSKRALIDYFGCGIAGCGEAVVDNTYRWAKARSVATVSSVIGKKGCLDAEHAAMCNAVAGHALDFDDTSWTTIGHPTVVAAPVALALAEQHGATGREVLRAYAAGVEVGHKIAQLTMPETSQNGWHTTAVYGVIIAAATHACLLKLDKETIVNGLAIAMTRAGGLRSNFGTMTKPLHAGLAVLSGMEAVGLVQEGITASHLAFEGADGFSYCFMGKATGARARFGQDWDLADNGLAFKLYPCCSGTHPAVDLMLRLIHGGAISAKTVKSIHVGSSLLGPLELVNHRPQTPVEARFSMEFALASVLIKGQLTLDEFTEAFVAGRDVQEMMGRISMDVDDALARLGFIGTAPVKLKITLTDGEVLCVENNLARGNPEKPLQDADITTKFLNNARRVVPEERAEALLASLVNLEAAPDIRAIMAATR
ncbi:MmgE/PrpD family protein [Desulfoluna spongiiphila]|uniref:2-methylcitrate dehydratase PrpD n=1 Tax=Desulfoluna spongiiphila TaxID=419481 RepID=A0A1G5CPJ8_9BACT|nr:MmgE/PrpD family protein [Desulfoluna spongiiphila]SCY04469.1 2-methylcitrate dehydratase PrpD [Desulfoluna spongiiphila]